MNIVRTCRNKLRIITSVAGTGWGCQKETLLRTYKTSIEPAMNYAAAIWSPNISDSSFLQIQRLQNRALRIATGCHSNTQIDHLHYECKVAHVKDHLEMLSAQFLASCSRTSHPSHEIIHQPQGARNMKQTLQSKHGSKISRFVTDGAIDASQYRNILDTLHTESVQQTINRLEPNPLLDTRPPPISPSETTLTRKQRSTLAQLRSGQCHLLNDYQVLTGRSHSALCPECLFRRHSVPHIFDCDANPTLLVIHDLWNNPVAVINFLVTLPSFSPLVPTVPPPPPLPPD